nr:hypothetical protein Iba_chr04dCG14310 [Ipomoea batatas]
MEMIGMQYKNVQIRQFIEPARKDMMVLCHAKRCRTSQALQESLFPYRDKVVSDGRKNSDAGMGPENEFSDKSRFLRLLRPSHPTRLVSFVIETEIAPLKSQYARSRWDNNLRFPMDSGTVPLKSHPARLKTVRLVNSAKKSGNGAEKAIPSSLITERDGSFSKRETLKPAMIDPSSLRSRLVIYPESLQLRPGHWQQSTLSSHSTSLVDVKEL